ncbi:MAG TPA: sulfotransferase [Caulobacteraceae bacterium]|nr:sulfotransferase [Caulobacteraceae bacterium]
MTRSRSTAQADKPRWLALLEQAEASVAAGRSRKARPLVVKSLELRPGQPAAWRLLSDLEMAAGDLQAALAARAKFGDSKDAQQVTHVRSLLGGKKFAEAVAALDGLLAKDPTDGLALAMRGAALVDLGRFDEAVQTYERIVARFPDQTHALIVYSSFLRALGETDGVVKALRACVAVDPACADAWLRLADIKNHHLTKADRTTLEGVLKSTSLPPEGRARLLFALAKAREDAGEIEAAFAAYAEGNAIERDLRRFQPDETTAYVRRNKAVFTPDFYAARAGWGANWNDPIFVVGMPRSGSSLVEQIIASHPSVEGAGELPDLVNIAATIAGYPKGVAALDRVACQRLGDEYLRRTKWRRNLGRPHFVDKRPQNFQHLGLIRLALPNAKVIDMRRNPLDNGVSIFRQHFAAGFNSAFDLGHIGRFYADYVDLMAHFETVQAGAVHRLIYEDLVADTEGEVRRLLAYLGLPFDPACLAFFDNRRAIDTPSAEQVRQPVYDRSIGVWRRFEPWIGPLKNALGPALESWRGDLHKSP